MVRMPGRNLYGSTSSAASRSRSSSSGENASLLRPNTTASTGETSKKKANSSLAPSGSGTGSNNSVRSTSSGSTSSSGRKLQRSSFRKTKMFQRNRRNSSSNSSTDGTSVMARSQISVVSQTAPSTVEEREAGADSPTFPLPKSPQEQVSEIPQGHIDSILRFYGGNDMSAASLDLYKDVLKVSPDASDREIRIAYFRRGREILGDNDGTHDEPADIVVKEKVKSLDAKTKSRFQAVSMAFEILSTPSWKEIYLKKGLRSKNINGKVSDTNTVTSKAATGSVDADAFSSPSSTVAAAFPEANKDDCGRQTKETAKHPVSSKPKIGVAQKRRNQRQMLQKMVPALAPAPTVTPALAPALAPSVLRKSSFPRNSHDGTVSPRRTRSAGQQSTSVRWKDHVEELVFANHPNEHAYEDSDDSDYESNDEEEILEKDEILERERIRKNTLQNSSASSGGKHANRDGAKRKKNKPKIVIESTELESHLQLIDDEAEEHFVMDFWDNFEESMDGLLSLVDSIGGGETSKGASRKKSSTAPKKKNIPRERRNLTNDALKRRSSHDAAGSSKTKVVVDCNNEEFMERSNSFPAPRSSPSSLDAVSPSPQPFGFNGGVISPDEKAGRTASETRVSSPLEMIADSWPFQVSESPKRKNTKEEKRQKPKLSPVRVVTSPPMLVTPSPKSKISNNSKDGTLPPSSEQDATMSVASTTYSNSQSQQQFFRPISPVASEVSEGVRGDFLPVSLKASSNKKAGARRVDPVEESDQFDMESRLSEMESVNLADLENPFRSKGSSSSPLRSANASQHKTLNSSYVPVDLGKNKGEGKKNRFKISMTSKIKGSVKEKEVSSCSGSSKYDQSVEDVFAGVEEDAPLQRCDMPDDDKLQVENISIKRSTSHMSDLSESVYSAMREKDFYGEAANPEIPASILSDEKQAVEPAAVTLADANSVLSTSTKKSLAERSHTSSACSSRASSTARDDKTFESKGVDELEDAGFFEYFMAYVGAVVTECANMGATAVGEEYHQDFLSLFSNDGCGHNSEVREQPTST